MRNQSGKLNTANGLARDSAAATAVYLFCPVSSAIRRRLYPLSPRKILVAVLPPLFLKAAHPVSVSNPFIFVGVW
jgi:hypothetical protein